MTHIHKLLPIILVSLSLSITIPLLGQTITMQSVQAEGEISLSIATHSDNSVISIDWGDGSPQSYTLGKTETECKGPATKRTITISGDIAKLNCMASKLTALDITQCPNLWVLQAAYNNIGEIDLSRSSALGNLEIFGNMIKELDLSACIKLERLVCSGNYLSELNVRSCKALKYLDCTRMGRITNLDLTNNNQLTNLLINECNIQHLILPKGQTPLVEFWCHKNQITDLDLSSYTDLEQVNCSDNPLKTLRIKAPKVSQLLIMNTELADFSFLSQMPLLTYLMLTGNKDLTDVDLSHNTLLTDLGLSQCNLKELDLSAQKKLKQLWAEGNQLMRIDLSPCIVLESVKLKGNRISQITFPQKAQITTLSLPKNQLAEISLEGLGALTTLDLGSNHLRELDLSACPQLQVLNLANNEIHNIVLRHTPHLRMLGVVNNGMSAAELDQIYKALPTLEAASTKINLYNGTKKDRAALTSTTDLAVERNWKPAVLGDGSWMGLAEMTTLSTRIVQQEGRVSIYPSDGTRTFQVSLYNSEGTLIHVEPFADAPLLLYLPARGCYLLLLQDLETGYSNAWRILY